MRTALREPAARVAKRRPDDLDESPSAEVERPPAPPVRTRPVFPCRPALRPPPPDELDFPDDPPPRRADEHRHHARSAYRPEPARRRDRRGLWRARGCHPPARARLPRHRGRPPGPARRARPRLPRDHRRRHLHLRRRPDAHHGAVPLRRAVGAERRAPRGPRRLRADHAVLPHPLRRHLARRLARVRLHRRRRPDAAPDRALQPGRREGLRPLSGEERGDLRCRLHQPRPRPLRAHGRHDEDHPGDGRPPEPPHGVRLRPEVYQGPAAPAGLQLPPAARRRQPVFDDQHLRADRVSGAQVGRVVRDGRHRRHRPGHGRSGGAHGRHDPPEHRRGGDHRRRPSGPEVAGDGRAAGERRAPAGRGRRLQRRRRVDLPPPRRHGAPKPLDR